MKEATERLVPDNRWDIRDFAIPEPPQQPPMPEPDWYERTITTWLKRIIITLAAASPAALAYLKHNQ